MPTLLWDASALAKRYFTEAGTAAVNALFSLNPAPPSYTTTLGYAESAAILRRRFNEKRLDLVGFNAARMLLDAEVLNGAAFTVMPLTDAAILAGVALTDRHNINSADAAILACLLRFAPSRPSVEGSVLVACDKRLLRAATAEGLPTLNPEAVSPADLPGVLASLDGQEDGT